MATDRQIEANRLNALKATGPKTREGKAASSQNALKTGLHAKSEVIATESREEYETLIAEYYERFQPAVPEERCLVDNLVTAEWLGRRYMAAIAGVWEYELRDMSRQDTGLAFMRNSQTIGRAQRCITATQRNFAQTLKQLHALQAQRNAETAPSPDNLTSDAPTPDAHTPDTKATNPKLVSFFHPEISAREITAEAGPPSPENTPIAA